VAWSLDSYGALRLLDAHGNAVIELTEAESGIYDGFAPGEGRYVLPSAATPPMHPAEDMVGDWAIARGTGKPICVLTLVNDPPGGRSFGAQGQARLRCLRRPFRPDRLADEPRRTGPALGARADVAVRTERRQHLAARAGRRQPGPAGPAITRPIWPRRPQALFAVSHTSAVPSHWPRAWCIPRRVGSGTLNARVRAGWATRAMRKIPGMSVIYRECVDNVTPRLGFRCYIPPALETRGGENGREDILACGFGASAACRRRARNGGRLAGRACLQGAAANDRAPQLDRFLPRSRQRFCGIQR